MERVAPFHCSSDTDRDVILNKELQVPEGQLLPHAQETLVRQKTGRTGAQYRWGRHTFSPRMLNQAGGAKNETHSTTLSRFNRRVELAPARGATTFPTIISSLTVQ